MAKVLVPYTDYFAQTIQRMDEEGLLLVTSGTDGKTGCDDDRLGDDWLILGTPNVCRAGTAIAPHLQPDGAG
jgi:hypothetical protein